MQYRLIVETGQAAVMFDGRSQARDDSSLPGA